MYCKSTFPLSSASEVPLIPIQSIRLAFRDFPVAFLLLAARPLREPIVQYGPFVMNTREEIEQAMADYKNGKLV